VIDNLHRLARARREAGSALSLSPSQQPSRATASHGAWRPRPQQIGSRFFTAACSTVIRSRARVSAEIGVIARGHLLYLTRVANRIVGGRYPYIGELVSPFEVLSIEMLAPDHPVYALRPASPLAVVPAACFYSPRNSFVYPGGEEDLGPAGGH
jgi:hypothetical protein